MTPWHITQHNALILMYSTCKGGDSITSERQYWGCPSRRFRLSGGTRDNSLRFICVRKPGPPGPADAKVRISKPYLFLGFFGIA